MKPWPDEIDEKIDEMNPQDGRDKRRVNKTYDGTYNILFLFIQAIFVFFFKELFNYQ